MRKTSSLIINYVATIFVAIMPLQVVAEPFFLNTKCTVCFTPGENCTAKIVKTIKQAKHSILVQAYTITSYPIEKALIKAARNKVNVQIIIDKNQYQQFPAPINYLAKANIPIWLDCNLSGLAHNKVMIIDNQTVITGSFNFTKAAQYNNAENLLIINDKNLAIAYSKNWQKRLQQSCKITNY